MLIYRARLALLNLCLISACGANQHPGANQLQAKRTRYETIHPAVFTIPGRIGSGLYDTDAIKAAVDSGDALLSGSVAGSRDVEHVRYEIYENSKSSSNALETNFGYVQAHYEDTISNNGQFLELSRISYRFIVLDGFGKSADEFFTITFERNFEDGKEVWYKTFKKSGDLVAFYRLLPEFARQKLWHLTGFLQKNSGKPAVAYNLTDADMHRTLLDFMLSLAPGVPADYGGVVTTYLLQKAALLGLDKVLQDETLRVGADYRITDATATKYTAQYEQLGKAIWEKLR